MPKEIFVLDQQTGMKIPASWFIASEQLEVMDSAETKHLLHEITQMEAQYAEFDTQGLSFPEWCVVEPVASWADYVGYEQKLKAGQAEFISRNATSFPTAKTGKRPHIFPVIPIGQAFRINYFDRLKALRRGESLESEGFTDIAEYIDQKLDEAFHLGGMNPDNLEVQGFFDYLNGGAPAQINAGTSIHKSTLGTGVGGNTWALKTGAEIVADVGTAISDVFKNSKKLKRATKLAMGLDAWGELSKKTLITDEGIVGKILPYLQATYPTVTFVMDPYLDAIDFDVPNETWDGQAGSGCIVAYDDSPMNIKFRANRREILRPYEHKGFTTTINAFGLTAGVVVKNTYFASYMKGVS